MSKADKYLLKIGFKKVRETPNEIKYIKEIREERNNYDMVIEFNLSLEFYETYMILKYLGKRPLFVDYEIHKGINMKLKEIRKKYNVFMERE